MDSNQTCFMLTLCTLGDRGRVVMDIPTRGVLSDISFCLVLSLLFQILGCTFIAAIDIHPFIQSIITC